MDDVPARFQVDFTGRMLLGTYRVAERMAEGGMGSIHLAEDTNLGRRVVVKVPHARFLGEPGFRTRFHREVSELVRLEHSHIVRILARGEEEGVPFFVLQYLGGGSLEDRLRKGTQDVQTAWSWLEPIATTLDFVHSRGVIHRDVKPANILFDEQGHVFLSDFGVVKALEARDSEGDMTAPGTGVGSPVYMSPEQGLGREVTPASDQYALAAAVYEALGGEPPFGRGSVVEVILRKEREAPKPLRSLAPDVPAACEAAVHRALERDPAARFPSCSAFAEAFAKGFDGAATFPRRRFTVLQGAFLVLVAVLIVGGLTRGFGLWADQSGGSTDDDGPPGVLVRVADFGAEPRRPLRYRLVPGVEQKVTLRIESETRHTLGKAPSRSTKMAFERDVDVRVESVEAGGTRLALKFHVPREAPGGEVSGLQRAMIQKTLLLVPELTGHGTMPARGGVLELKLEADRPPLEPGNDPAIEADSVLRSIGVVLPAEAVGKGAVWDVSQIASVGMFRYQQTSTYELVEMDGDRLRLRIQQRGTAPEQSLSMPGVDASVQTRVESIDADGKGTLVLSLDRPLPVEAADESTMAMDVVAATDKETEKIHSEVRARTNLRER